VPALAHVPESGLRSLTSGGQPVRLNLLAHGLATRTSPPPQAHPELLIQVEDLDDLLDQLANEQFQFVLPNEPPPSGHTCSVTFDDGYANNALFLPIAERYRIPFVLFVSSLNIEQQLPYLWDAKAVSGDGAWRHWSDDYREAYRHLTPETVRRLLGDENHRPFTVNELRAFADNQWTHLALHTHSHQPLVGRFLATAAQEIEENRRFLSGFPRVLPRDLALPCGLYTPWTGKHLLNGLVDRIYTCDGGASTPGEDMVHRISLVSPTVRGSLISQVRRAFEWKVWLRRQVANIRYSNKVLNGL